jgi:hypothetical protein
MYVGRALGALLLWRTYSIMYVLRVCFCSFLARARDYIRLAPIA